MILEIILYIYLLLRSMWEYVPGTKENLNTAKCLLVQNTDGSGMICQLSHEACIHPTNSILHFHKRNSCWWNIAPYKANGVLEVHSYVSLMLHFSICTTPT